MWRVIKFFNKRINEMLCVRMRWMINLNLFPVISDVRSAYFQTTGNSDWGSARPDMGSVSYTDNAILSDEPSVMILTQEVPSMGYGFGTQVKPPSVMHRHWRSGEVTWRDIRPEGVYKVVATFDPGAIGNWEAIWFLETTGKRYREIDIERMYDPGKDWREIVISVHKGLSSTAGRRIYNHQYKIPSEKVEFTFNLKWPFTRIYVNGILVFVGLQWRVRRKASFIIGSGVIGRFEYDPRTRPGVFIVDGIQKRTNDKF